MTELEVLGAIAHSLKLIAGELSWISFILALMLMFKNMGGKQDCLEQLVCLRCSYALLD